MDAEDADSASGKIGRTTALKIGAIKRDEMPGMKGVRRGKVTNIALSLHCQKLCWGLLSTVSLILTRNK